MQVAHLACNRFADLQRQLSAIAAGLVTLQFMGSIAISKANPSTSGWQKIG